VTAFKTLGAGVKPGWHACATAVLGGVNTTTQACLGIEKQGGQQRCAPLLALVATLLLCLAGASGAQAQIAPGTPPCDGISGTEVTCTGTVGAGDLGQGIELTSPSYDTLILMGLDGAIIAPNAGVEGIDFTSTSGGSITIHSDTTGIPGISTTDAAGILASTSNIVAGNSAGTGPVTVDSTGTITTVGDTAYGIVAATYGFAIYSGSGAAEGTSGAVEITHTGNITTGGDSATGIYASGAASAYTTTLNASDAIATSGDVTVTSENVGTTGNSAYGIFGENFASALGEVSGTISATAGAIDIISTGTITTQGSSSIGIFARGTASSSPASNGAGSTANGSDITVTSADISTLGSDARGIYARARTTAVGYGSDGAQSNGGTITVTSADVSTLGASAHGISVDTRVSALSHGSGTYSATGGAIDITSTGTLTTEGIEAHGIYTSAEATASASTTDATAAGGVITVTNSDVGTLGDNADAIHLLSIVSAETGGSGTAQADGGNVIVNSGGIVSATGTGSRGIFAMSSGDTTNGDITINILTGSVTGGSDSGVGIQFGAGADNELNNAGEVSALSGLAVLGDSGSETVNNTGIITGNVDLGSGANVFNNMAGSLFNSGATANLGRGNTLTNAGMLSPGGVGVVQTTSLTGNLVQTSSGVFVVDLNGATSDSVTVSGTADLAGTVEVNVTGLPPVSDYLILDSSNTINNGLSVADTADTLFVNYELVFAPNEEVHLIADVNFAVSGLNQNQTNIAENLNDAYDAGIGGLGGVLAGLANLTSDGAAANALDQLSPEIYADTQLAALYASLDFSNNLLSCRINGRNAAAINKQGQCVWAAAKWRETDRDATSQNIGFDEQAWQFSGGAQVALDPVWRLNFGLGYQNTSLDTDTGAKSDGEMLQGGVALKYNPGALLLAGIVSGGRGWYDTTRPMAFGNFAATANGHYDIDVFQGRLHASYVMGTPSLFFKPMIDAAATYVGLDDVNESYANGAGLNVHGNDETIYSLVPAIEVGTEWWTTAGTLFRPFVRGGVTWFSEDDVTVSASFAGAPDGVGPFSVRASTDEVLYDLSAGLEMITAGETNVRVFYDCHFGDDTDIHSVGLKGSAKF